ncbi:radical SAM protein [bacterium]|nr:radical SAM protein [bacterium]
MARIIEVCRKAEVLKHPSLPCLSHFHTINLLAGCPYECRYCYARSYRSNPGNGKVLFYCNTFDLLRYELLRKRKRPVLVYFSTACEPFIPYEMVSDVLFSVMKLLLDHNVSLLISTKSPVSDRFVNLFAHYPGKIHIQVGMTMTDDRIRRLLEPNASSVEVRLTTLRKLREQGIHSEVRMDPLIPGLTDTEESFTSLCKQISECDITHAAASYLFIRRANYQSMMIRFNGWSFEDIFKELYTEIIVKYCGNGTVTVPDAEYRRIKYGELRSIAHDYGITLHLCACKNNDITHENCHSTSIDSLRIQTELFD